MSNDKVQSIMELVDTITDCAQKGYPFSNMRIVLESAIREAIAAPGVAQPIGDLPAGWELVQRLMLEAELFWWNDGPEGKTAKNLYAARDAVLAAIAASPTAAERPPYCGSGHCSCIECPYGSIKGGTEE